MSTFAAPVYTAFLWHVWLIWYANLRILRVFFGNNYSIISIISSQCQFAWWLLPSNGWTWHLKLSAGRTLTRLLTEIPNAWRAVLFSKSRFHLALNLRQKFQGMHFRSQVCIARSLNTSKFILFATELWSDRSISIVSVFSHDKSRLFHIIDLVIGSVRLSYAPLGLSIHVVASFVLALWRCCTHETLGGIRHPDENPENKNRRIEDEHQNLCHTCQQLVAMSSGLYILWQDWGALVMFSWDLVLDASFSVSTPVTGSLMLAVVCP